MILAITGHRPEKLGGYSQPNSFSTTICEKLSESFQMLKPTLVLSGMALGVDQWAAQVCIHMKIPFDAIVPFEGQESRWPRSSVEYYDYLKGKARRVMMLSPGPYSPGLLHARNEWMVDHSNALLAVWNGDTEGGTYSCLKYAWSKPVPHPVYKIDLPKYFWDMAGAAEQFQNHRKKEKELKSQQETIERARRNAEFVKYIEEQEKREAKRFMKQAEKLAEKPPEPTGLTFRRVVDVGEEEP